MTETVYEVRTYRNNRPNGILPSQFDTKDEAIVFANRLKELYGDQNVNVRIYVVTEVSY